MIVEIAKEAADRLAKRSPDDAAWFELQRNKLATLDGRSNAEAVLSLTASVVQFFYSRGALTVALGVADRGVVIARTQGMVPEWRKLSNALGVTLLALGDYGSAANAFTKSLELATELNDPVAQARAWGNLAATAYRSAAFEQAIEYARRSLAIASACGQLAVEMKVQGNQIIAECSMHLMYAAPDPAAWLGEGLLRVENAVREAGEPQTALGAQQMTLLYLTQTQLLARAGRRDEAKAPASLCEKYAEQAGDDGSRMRASLAQALVGGVGGADENGPAVLRRMLNENANRPDAKADIVAVLAFVAEQRGDAEAASAARRELYAGWRQRETTNVIRRLDDLKARYPIEPMQMLNAVTQEAIETLAIVGELHDDETGEDVFRVGALASLIAKRLGLGDEEAMQIDFAARLHDIGKIAVHADIMTKRAELTTSERAEMMKHTTIGHEMLARIPHPVISMAADIALNHHERWDGRGYPNGIARESIPLAARITSVADVFDALTHARCYKAAWTVEDSVSEIARNSEKAFDPNVVDAFLAVMIDLVGEHAKDGLDAALSVHAKENRYLAAKNFLAGVSSVRVAA